MKKSLLFLTLILITELAFAGLKSPFPSSVEGIEIPNTHSISEEGDVLRGMAPLGRLEELVNYGITDVLIFKNQTRNEVDKEIAGLKELGYEDNAIHQIDFRWKNMESEQVACEQSVEAFKLIQATKEWGGRIFFHCTVGEDRTGFLSGLYKMMSSNISRNKAFYYEMCENGYGAGNPQKLWVVVNAIRNELTPLFKKMAKAIELGMLSLDQLNQVDCGAIVKLKTDSKKLTCKASSKYQK